MARLRYLQNKRSGAHGTICKGLTDIYFRDDDMYIGPWEDGGLDMVSDNNIWLFSDDIYFVGDVHYYGTIHETSTAEFDILLTDPTAAANAVHAVINAGVDWTTGSLAAVRGQTISTTTTLTSGNMYGGWFGMMLDTGFTGAGLGLTCGIYANVDTANTVSAVPSAVAYFEIASGTGADYANMPILVLADGSTSQSNYAFSLGFAPAGNTVSASNSSDILYQQTIHIMANGSDAYIPYSTAAGNFTTAYPIVTTYATTAIDISTCTTGIDITGAATGINLNGTMTTAITIGDGATTGISITGASGYAINIQTTGHFRMGLGPDTGDVGIPVTSASPHNLEVYTDASTAFTTTINSFGIRSRYLISVEQTAAAEPVTITAVDARLRVKHATANGVFSGIQGTIEASTTNADFGGGTGTLRAAGSFTLDFSSDVAITGGGWICGVSIDSAVSDSVSMSAAQFVALRISTGTSQKEIWEHGIWMGDDDAVVGMQIGDCTTGITLDGTITTGLNIASGAVTGISVAAASTAGIAISGANATGIVMTGTYSTAGISITTDMAEDDDYCLYIAAECDDTSGGTILPVYVVSVIDGTGGNGRAAEFKLAPTATMGDWGNAVKGYLNLDDSAGSIGLLSAVCAELKLPNEGMSGTLTCLELEMQTPTSGLVYGGPLGSLSFIYAALGGTQAGVFDDSGNILTLAGLTDETGHVFFDNTLRIVVSGTTWYLPMSSAQASYTTAYPIAQSGSMTTGISLTGTYTTGLNIASTLAAADASAIKSIVTVATPVYTDGAGAHNFQLTTTGTVAGHAACASFWINTATGTTGTGNSYLTPICTGIWEDSGASMANTKVVVGARIQGILGDTNYTSLNVFSLNIVQDITALWEVSQFNSNIGFTAGTNESSTPSGYVAFMSDVGQNVKYIRLYDDMS